MLNGVKHLNTSTYALQILRFAQDDREKGKWKNNFRTGWGDGSVLPSSIVRMRLKKKEEGMSYDGDTPSSLRRMKK